MLRVLFAVAYIAATRAYSNIGQFPRLRPMSAIESGLANTFESLKSPSDSLVKAMVRTGTNMLSVSDGMKISGLSQEDVQRDLMLLSGITQGTIEVDEEGELIYSFPKDFNQILREKNLGTKIKAAKEVLAPPLMYMTRVSFGVMLITSLAILVTAALSVSGGGGSSSGDRSSGRRSSNNDDREDRRGGGGGGGLTIDFSSAPDLLGFFRYRPRYGYYYYNDPYISRKRDPERVSFFESFFSFVFGDGNPNHNFNERRLQKIAEVIRSKDGVVVAEDLAPYLNPPYAPLSAIQQAPTDVKPSISRAQLDLSIAKSESSVVDESWALPAVVQFGGVPEVTDNGNIYYRFDQLKQSLSANAGSGKEEGGEAWMEEQEIPFSRASPGQQLLAGGLGAANLVGVAWLGGLLRRMTTMTRDALALRALFPFLLFYALLYVTFPAMRAMDIQKKNEQIRQNNTNRKLWALFATKVRDADFINKIDDVRHHTGTRAGPLGPRKIIYTTAVEKEDDNE